MTEIKVSSLGPISDGLADTEASSSSGTSVGVTAVALGVDKELVFTNTPSQTPTKPLPSKGGRSGHPTPPHVKGGRKKWAIAKSQINNESEALKGQLDAIKEAKNDDIKALVATVRGMVGALKEANVKPHDPLVSLHIHGWDLEYFSVAYDSKPVSFLRDIGFLNPQQTPRLNDFAGSTMDPTSHMFNDRAFGKTTLSSPIELPVFLTSGLTFSKLTRVYRRVQKKEVLVYDAENPDSIPDNRRLDGLSSNLMRADPQLEFWSVKSTGMFGLGVPGVSDIVISRVVVSELIAKHGISATAAVLGATYDVISRSVNLHYGQFPTLREDCLMFTLDYCHYLQVVRGTHLKDFR